MARRPIRADLAVGGQHSLALKQDGTLWVWGAKHSGQIGNGGTANQLTRVQIRTSTEWLLAHGGYWNSLAAGVNGLLVFWGFNGEGQLGDLFITTAMPLEPDKGVVQPLAGRMFRARVDTPGLPAHKCRCGLM